MLRRHVRAVTLILSFLRSGAPDSISASSVLPLPGLAVIASRIRIDYLPSGFAMTGSSLFSKSISRSCGANREKAGRIRNARKQ